MSDTSKRIHERRQSSALDGDVHSRARLLAQRLRHGELSAAALDFAAYCGDLAAQEVSEVRPPDEEDAWLEGLRGWSHPARVCVCYAMALAELRRWRGRVCECGHHESVHPAGRGACVQCSCVRFSVRDDYGVPAALAALRAWLLEPSAARSARLRRAVKERQLERAPWAAFACYAAWGRPEHDWVTTLHSVLTVEPAHQRAALAEIAGAWATSAGAGLGSGEPPERLRHLPASPWRLVFYEDSVAELEALLAWGAREFALQAGSLIAWVPHEGGVEGHELVVAPEHSDGRWRVADLSSHSQDSVDERGPWSARSVGGRIHLFATFSADAPRAAEGVSRLSAALAEVIRSVRQISTPWWFIRDTMRGGLGLDPPNGMRIGPSLHPDPSDPASLALDSALDEMFGDL